MFLLSDNRKRKKKVYHVKPPTSWTILILACARTCSIYYYSSPLWYNLKGKITNFLSQTEVQPLRSFISSINMHCTFVTTHVTMTLALELGGLSPFLLSRNPLPSKAYIHRNGQLIVICVKWGDKDMQRACGKQRQFANQTRKGRT